MVEESYISKDTVLTKRREKYKHTNDYIYTFYAYKIQNPEKSAQQLNPSLLSCPRPGVYCAYVGPVQGRISLALVASEAPEPPVEDRRRPLSAQSGAPEGRPTLKSLRKHFTATNRSDWMIESK